MAGRTNMVPKRTGSPPTQGHTGPYRKTPGPVRRQKKDGQESVLRFCRKEWARPSKQAWDWLCLHHFSKFLGRVFWYLALG